MRKISLLLLALSLSGCVSAEDPWLNGQGESSVATGSATRMVSTHLAWGRISALAEAPLTVRNFTGDEAVVQQIVYRNRSAGAGENMLTIERGSSTVNRLRQAPTSAALARDMRAALPDVVMVPEPTFRQNAYGSYGAALGALPGGGACVYAWQTIAAWPGSDFSQRQSATVRLRYCDPKATQATAANLLSTLSLGPSQSEAPQVYALSPEPARYGYTQDAVREKSTTTATAEKPPADKAVVASPIPMPNG